MFYVEDKKLKRFFDYEKQETKDEKNKRLLQNKPEPKLPWSFDLTYLNFGQRYTYTKNKGFTRYTKLGRRVTRMQVAYPGNDYYYLRILLKYRSGMTDPDDLLLGPEGNMKYPNYKLACLAWEFIDNSSHYFSSMHEAYELGCIRTKLLKFFAGIIKEGILLLKLNSFLTKLLI